MVLNQRKMNECYYSDWWAYFQTRAFQFVSLDIEICGYDVKIKLTPVLGPEEVVFLEKVSKLGRHCLVFARCEHYENLTIQEKIKCNCEYRSLENF